MAIFPVASFAFGFLLRHAGSARIQAGAASDVLHAQTSQTSESHPVSILISRHGFSCANIVAYFREDVWHLSHTNMKDPLLSSAGGKFSSDVKPAIQSAFDKPPDAVLSSVLVRSIETALLQYDAMPVYVAPYIREDKPHRGNEWRSRGQQIQRLVTRYPDKAWMVDYRYVERFGYHTEGDWSKFIDFLTNTFIPDLVRKTGKRNGDPIVLAVVTHANIMNHGFVFDACQRLYFNRTGKVKSNNNQVVKLSYNFDVNVDLTQRDVTQTRHMQPIQDHGDTRFCEPVVEGVPVRTEDGALPALCKSDIGDDCLDQIRKEGRGSVPEALEDEATHKCWASGSPEV